MQLAIMSQYIIIAKYKNRNFKVYKKDENKKKREKRKIKKKRYLLK